MQAEVTQSQDVDLLTQLNSAIKAEDSEQIKALLADQHPADIALLLESLPANLRAQVWSQVPPEHEGEVLLSLNDEARSAIIKKMQPGALLAATETLDTDDLADILPEMPRNVIQELLLTMEQQERDRLHAVLGYPENTAGGLMNLDSITVRPDISLDVVIRYLRRRGEVPETTDRLFVVDRDGLLLGILPITYVLTHDPEITVESIMQSDIDAIPAHMSAQDVANMFERRDLVTAPVVDENNKLLGRITIDDVVDVIRDQSDQSLMGMAGLTVEEDLFAPVLMSAKRRAFWLGINLITAIIASGVIRQFDQTINHFVALAVLMPIVASMGGIAGSQTLTLVIRGMALGQISNTNARRLLFKEIGVGLLNGLIWACLLALFTEFYYHNHTLSLVIAIAIGANLLVAAITGVLLPVFLHRLRADPALAGSVILTTFTDVAGYFVFLGLATLILI
ncbi:MAG: magnesium transporter [Gammaproteobacteria bacterium]|nr:magnesium transporter [Gammaproteobacteria bacterium]